MPREPQERTDFSHAFSRHCHDLCRLRVHANPLLRCNMAEVLHALAHEHLETDLDEMLLVTPSWPGVSDQLMHCVAHLLIKFRRLAGSSHLFYIPVIVSHLSKQDVDVLGHFGLLWLCNAPAQLLFITEVFFHLDFPAGQLLSISKGQLAFTLVQSVQSVNQTIRVTFLDRMRSAAVSSTSRRSCHYLSNQVAPTSRCIMQQVSLDIAIGRCWYTTGAKEVLTTKSLPSAG
ncbi:hypothetical protein T4E_7420 [Trichinella pseudospiralis]|uniref:Uncharacterized protein n=1 Tax=Trichinella pseudospiralis TaxID=6337 RepID=A0A0V0XF48_TRIPS|nr:hypothetical protein T4E_7420 [Trichinella pseudospiralis]